jgi:hypothetical protein
MAYPADDGVASALDQLGIDAAEYRFVLVQVVEDVVKIAQGCAVALHDCGHWTKDAAGGKAVQRDVQSPCPVGRCQC